MKTWMEMQKKLYPDILEIIERRHSVLSNVDIFQPIGRRSLAANTNVTERVIRSEVNFLHQQGLIETSANGMRMTNEGKRVLEQLRPFMKEVSGLVTLEKNLEKYLPVQKVLVVPGNSDKNEWVKQEMGKACVSHLKTHTTLEPTIAVTGGSTMAALSEVMVPLPSTRDGLFLPARGGLGEKAENQANTIVAKMAQKADGTYRQLYVPDPLSESSYHTLMQEPSVMNVLNRIHHADMVIHSIGDALTMAKRRNTDTDVMEKLKQEHAVSEAFGYYFDAEGRIIHKVRTVGMHLEDLTSIETVITLAGGQSKAKAIISFFKHGKSDVFITDEAAAKKILKEVSL